MTAQQTQKSLVRLPERFSCAARQLDIHADIGDYIEQTFHLFVERAVRFKKERRFYFGSKCADEACVKKRLSAGQTDGVMLHRLDESTDSFGDFLHG